jgi:hypothetical protein
MKCTARDHVKDVVAKVYDLGGTVLEMRPLKFNLEDYLLEALGDTELLEDADHISLPPEQNIHASH